MRLRIMNRIAMGKAAVVVVIVVLVLGGAVGVYLYTSAPPTNPITTSSNTGGSGATTSTGSQTSTTAGSTPSGAPAGGYMDANGQPQGTWASYLGYIPNGYPLAPHSQYAAQYPCPSGMNSAQCTLFKSSCGNGVCDPNESCATCPIDCGVPGQLTCDPYTGRPGAPISVCQIQH